MRRFNEEPRPKPSSELFSHIKSSCEAMLGIMPVLVDAYKELKSIGKTNYIERATEVVIKAAKDVSNSVELSVYDPEAEKRWQKKRKQTRKH